jgi:hypothetical protein
MKGGAIDFTNKYVIKKLNDTIENDLNAQQVITKMPTNAVLIISEGPTYDKEHDSITKFPLEILKKVIGLSWYATLKLMNEFINLDDDVNTKRLVYNDISGHQMFINKFFKLDKLDPKMQSQNNFNKSVIISFIHGVHGYLVAKKKYADVPNLDAPILDRYMYVSDKVNKSDIPEIASIWTQLCKTILGIPDPNKPEQDLGNADKIKSFLNKPPNRNFEVDNASIYTGEDLADIAYLFDLESVMLRFTDKDE